MRVVVLCRDPFLLAGMQSLLSGASGVRLAPSDGTFAEATQLIRAGSVDAILLCGEEPFPREFAELSHLRSQHRVRVIAISPFGQAATGPSSRLADALIPRDHGLEGLQRALANLQRQLAREAPVPKRRSPRLTKREIQACKLISEGKSNRQIADRMGLKEQSVKNLVSLVMRKLDCENRVQVALHFMAEPTKIAG